MGRPNKVAGTVPTRERILVTAMELFSERGYDAVSIREITRTLGLNEASLYNHFAGKAELLAAIFQRMEERLIQPGFSVPPPEAFPEVGGIDLADFLAQGAQRFFRAAGRETLYTWRILMAGQYRYEAARDSVQTHLLDAPRLFFTGILESLKAAGRIRPDAECASAGRVIAAVFFEYSFRSNLERAWAEGDEEVDDMDSEDFARLRVDLGFVAEALRLA